MWTNGEISAMLDIIEFQALSKFAGKYEGPLQDLPTEWDKIARKTNKSIEDCKKQWNHLIHSFDHVRGIQSEESPMPMFSRNIFQVNWRHMERIQALVPATPKIEEEEPIIDPIDRELVNTIIFNRTIQRPEKMVLAKISEKMPRVMSSILKDVEVANMKEVEMALIELAKICTKCCQYFQKYARACFDIVLDKMSIYYEPIRVAALKAAAALIECLYYMKDFEGAKRSVKKFVPKCMTLARDDRRTDVKNAIFFSLHSKVITIYSKK